MAKHTFNYANKTTHEFDDEGINVNDARCIRITFPSDQPNGYAPNEYIWISQEDRDVHDKYGYGTWPKKELDKVRVGVLRYPVSRCGFPRGIFIPYKFGQNGNAMHAMDGLRSEFIYHQDYKPVKA